MTEELTLETVKNDFSMWRSTKNNKREEIPDFLWEKVVGCQLRQLPVKLLYPCTIFKRKCYRYFKAYSCKKGA